MNPLLPQAMIGATIYLVLIMHLILLAGWVMSQEKLQRFGQWWWLQTLKQGRCEHSFLFLFSLIFIIFLEFPTIYILMWKFNIFSCWLTARVKKNKNKQLFSTSGILEDHWLLLKVRFSFPYVTNLSILYSINYTSDGFW